MKVLKTINNNIVSCMTDDGQELVAMGRGLGYRFRPGALLGEEQAEKIFRMDSQSQTERLENLLRSLPSEQIDLCTRLIAYAAKTLGGTLSKSIYLTLPDHINFAITRLEQGVLFTNPLLTEVRIFYAREFLVGCHALEMLRQELGVEFPEDEAASIALHFVNAECDITLNETMRITQTLHGAMNILSCCPGIVIQPGTLAYDELTVHLKFLTMQVFSGEPQAQAQPTFVQSLRDIFPNEFRCAEAMSHYLERQSGRPVTQEQLAFLALNIRHAEAT